jgi:hypothetical protein
MSIVLLGSTSGSCTLQEQAVAGTTTLTLPTFNGTVGLLVSGTAVASTSGTSIDFTSIPAGVRRITVMFNEVSSSGTSNFLIQLGDSGGIENTGYVSTSNYTNQASTTGGSNSTAGYLLFNSASSGAALISGTYTLVNISGNTWIGSGVHKIITTQVLFSGGSKALSDVLTQIRVTTVNGTDTFDAGSINILYE